MQLIVISGQRLRTTLLFFVASILLFTPMAQAEEPNVPENIPGTTKVSANEVFDLAGELDDLVIIDARKKGDFDKGHIEGAASLPDTDTDEAGLAALLESKNTPVLFYCNGAKCGRSVKSAEKAVSYGYKKIYWFRGGWEEWLEKGYPVGRY